MKSWTTLVDVDRDWAPSSVGTSLYIRPTVIASEPFLGVRPAKQYLYYVIISPVGPYYPGGLAPTQIKVIDNYVRAVAGGLGEAKTSANYAASLYAAEEAKHEGFTQVLWLDGVQHKYIEEVGTSNIMLQIRDEVITPPLGGTILAGVTRDSVLTLLRSWGVRVSERQITIDEVVAAAGDGTLKEVWAHRHRGGHLAGGRAGLQGPPLRGQRGPDRRAGPEAVRHDRGHPIRNGARSPRLDYAGVREFRDER